MKKLLLIALATLCIVPLSAQQDDLDQFARPRRMVFFFETEPDRLSPFDEFLLYNGILSTVGTANPSVVMVESPDRAVPASQTGKEDVARNPLVSADAWLHIYVAGDLEFLTVRAEIYDMLYQELVSEITIQPGFPVSYRVLARGLWDEIAQEIADQFEPVVDTTEVTIKAVPGTEITGLAQGSHVLETNELAVSLPNPATYTAVATRDGYVRASTSFYVGFQPVSLEFVQRATPQMAVDAGISSFQFPGTRYWYYLTPAPDEWFLRGGIATQLIGINFVPNRPLFSSAPLTSITVDGGRMFLAEDSVTRLYAALGGFLRVTHEPQILGIDSDGAYGGLHLSLGAEVMPWAGVPFLQQFSLFVDYQPTFFFAPSPAEFVEVSFSWNAFPDGRPPGFVVLDWGLIDLRNLNLGAKFSW